MALLLARHGETALNRSRTVQPADTALSDRGLTQAAALAQRLVRDHRVSTVIASDLLRARQSAAPIARLLGLTVELEPGLAERNFGVLRGRAYDSLGFDPLGLEAAPEGGESMRAFSERVSRSFGLLCARLGQSEGDTLWVTHGLVLRELFAHHLDCTKIGMVTTVGNASLTIVEGRPPFTVRLLACEAHLSKARARSGVVGI